MTNQQIKVFLDTNHSNWINESNFQVRAWANALTGTRKKKVLVADISEWIRNNQRMSELLRVEEETVTDTVRRKVKVVRDELCNPGYKPMSSTAVESLTSQMVSAGVIDAGEKTIIDAMADEPTSPAFLEFGQDLTKTDMHAVRKLV